MALPYTATVGEAAHAALETLVVIRKHKRDCKQCRTDPAWCDLHRQYQDTFIDEFNRWEKMARRANAA